MKTFKAKPIINAEPNNPEETTQGKSLGFQSPLDSMSYGFATFAKIAASLLPQFDFDSAKSARAAWNLIFACAAVEAEHQTDLKYENDGTELSEKFGWPPIVPFKEVAKYLTGQDRGDRAEQQLEALIEKFFNTPKERKMVLGKMKAGLTPAEVALWKTNFEWEKWPFTEKISCARKTTKKRATVSRRRK